MSELERLTVFKDGFWEHKDFPELKDKDCIDKFVDCVKELAERLAQYEDAEEQGLILRLPCKLGDTVYCYCETFNRVFAYQIENIIVSAVARQYEAHANEGSEFIDVIEFSDDDIGVSIFLIREEAEEAALEERFKE